MRLKLLGGGWSRGRVSEKVNSERRAVLLVQRMADFPSPGHTSMSRQGAPTRSQTPLLKSLFRTVFSRFYSVVS